MAFTQITSAGFGLTTGTLVGVAASFSSTVSVGGTLTYEDVTNVDSVGLITARNGIEVTDKGVQVGTGATVDSAGDNILTFLTNGSERIRIDSSGTAEFTSNLAVNGSELGSRTLRIQDSTTDNAMIYGDNSGSLSIQGGASQPGSGITLLGKSASTDPGTIKFFTTVADNNIASAERMRIDSSGNVGIKNTVAATIDAVNNAGTLVVGDGSSAEGITIYTSDSTAGELAFADATSGSGTQRGRIIYAHGDNSMRISTNGAEAMRIDSSGRLGVATTPEAWSGFDALEVNEASIVSSGSGDAFFTANAYYDGAWKYKDTGVARNIYMNSDGIVFRQAASGSADASVSWSESMRLDSSGRLLFGHSSSRDVANVAQPNIQIEGTNVSTSTLSIARNSNDAGGPVLALSKTRGTSTGSSTVVQSGDTAGAIYFSGADGTDVNSYAAWIEAEIDGTPGGNDMPGRLVFSTTSDGGATPAERMRIDSNGRLLINTATEIDTGTAAGSVHMAAGGGGKIYMMRNDATTVAGNDLGMIRFYSNDGTEQEAARIVAEADASHATDDKPGRILLMTTGDNESTPTERMRLTSSGDFRFAMGDFGDESVSGNSVNDGVVIDRAGGVKLQVARSNGTPMVVNRIGNDGNIINLRQGGSQEGTISVSGSTVSYNGAHLSRWSQLVGISTNIKSDRPTILRGSVLSNLDEMCEWGEEDNEQLNRMKVSDVEGDINVAGVFQSWDDDDDTYTNDFYCAMTGDFVIRIASGVTVQRGNLLMSAGDGTAKPQGDGYIQDKTIAKVTSTTVSTTYSDGSYCVPCVLMAC